MAIGFIRPSMRAIDVNITVEVKMYCRERGERSAPLLFNLEFICSCYIHEDRDLASAEFDAFRDARISRILKPSTRTLA